MTCNAPGGLRSKRAQVVLAYVLLSRRYGLADVFKRAERIATKMNIAPAHWATCSLTQWGAAVYTGKCNSWSVQRRGLRTRYR